MNTDTYGTVAALQYAKRPKLDFATIVKEFDNSFQLIEGQERSQTWVCRDTVIIDREIIRIALGWLNPSTPGAPWHLIIAIGNTPKQADNTPIPGYLAALAQYIVGHFSYILPYDAILHGTANRPVSSEVIRTVADLLRLSENAVPHDSPPIESDNITNNIDDERPGPISDARLNEILENIPGNTKRAFDAPDDTDTATASDIVADAAAEDAISLPKRLTIYTLGLTMAMQVPPVGAFLLTYAALRDGAVTIS